jgi:hypothetical protein
MKKTLCAIVLLGLLGACAAPQDRLGGIVATPFRDLNLTDGTIPPVLLDAKAAPYAPPPLLSCTALWTQVQVLDLVLGPDLDAPAKEGDSGKLAWATVAAGDAAAGALQGAVEGAIPFRGWVRKLSGAERSARENAAAIAAGSARRAFLKGMASGRDCQRPVESVV